MKEELNKTYLIIKEMESEYNKVLLSKKNEIICEYKINELDIDIKLFNLNSPNKEKELFKKMELYLDSEKIPFNNKHQFTTVGKHILTIKIKQNLNYNDIEYLFKDCIELIKIDLTNFETNEITSFKGLFQGCVNLKEIKGLNNIKTSQIVNLENMFHNCENIEYLDLSNFDTRNVYYFNSMFKFCSKLKEIKGLYKLNAFKASETVDMFFACKSLASIDISNFNSQNLVNISSMFAYCSNLKEIKGLNNFKSNIIENLNYLFSGCTSLTTIDLTDFNTKNVKTMEGMFNNCINLKEIKGFKN